MGEKPTFRERVRRFFLPKYVVQRQIDTLGDHYYLTIDGSSRNPLHARRFRFKWHAWLAMDLMMEEHHLTKDRCGITMIIVTPETVFTPASFTLYPCS
jgi:hypothetical protein